MAPRDDAEAELQRTSVPGAVPMLAPSPNGIAAAAVLAAAIGSAVLGLIVTLASASPWLSDVLSFYGPVGSLSGRTMVAVLAWLIAWLILHLCWRRRQVRFKRVYLLSLFLIAIGLLGTFPLFYSLFHHAE
ncbi:MAG: hypothetical protein ACM359_12320 [Bacillota bacterium]